VVSIRRVVGDARSRLALAIVLLAGTGLAVATYLVIEKLSGRTDVCLVGGGCDIVNASVYSEVMGIPLAAFGAAYSALVLALALAWWGSGRQGLLLALYAVGLVGVIVEAYLVYLQVAVIRAFCSWCLVYGATVVLGWLVVAVAVWHSRRSSVVGQ
jgi:uncharacterized membrane protein